MIRIFRKNYFVLALLCCAMYSCEKITLRSPNDIELLTDTISFSENIQPIFDDQCVGCHGGSKDPDLSKGKSYNALLKGFIIATEDTSKVSSMVLYKKLFDKEYNHLEKTTTDEKLIIKTWLYQGAKDN